ncbi:PP2A regulatory subunit TAP46 [Glycine soja]|uniref:PP2A regulatory subunit TAP46 n=1 Tax=Glycine soja TaxID=3848 RepID=A0A445FDC5_GLYSO|nr:PP2A regulatory subunit TAP46 [Glycine soja]
MSLILSLSCPRCLKMAQSSSIQKLFTFTTSPSSGLSLSLCYHLHSPLPPHFLSSYFPKTTSRFTPPLLQTLTSFIATTAFFFEVVKKGCEALHRCEDMVNNLGLFSPNKTKEDISTTNLKYILGLDLNQEGEALTDSSECRPWGSPEGVTRSTKATAPSTLVEAREEEVLDDDGEEEREALDLLNMLKKEEEMLSAVKDRQSKVVQCLVCQILHEALLCVP